MEFSIYNVKFKDLFYYGKLTHIPERIIYSYKFQYLMSAEISYRKQGLMIIFGLLIVFVVVEIAANVWWQNMIHCELEENEIFQNISEEDKRQICVDLYNLRIFEREIIPNQHYDTININSEGFRGKEISILKPDNTFRIVAVGGSTMFGAGSTSDETTIPAYLERMLKKQNFNFEIEVINAGIAGHYSTFELLMIKEKIVNYKPDLLIEYDGWNDVRNKPLPSTVENNWKEVCKIGNENDFDVIIILQPLAGFGNKILTEQEQIYADTGVDYSGIHLLSLKADYYDKYAENLKNLEFENGKKLCTKVADLQGAFDNVSEPVYWDQGHTSDNDNFIMAQEMFELVYPIILENSSEIPSGTNDNNVREAVGEEASESLQSLSFEDLFSRYKTPIMFSQIIEEISGNKSCRYDC